MMKFVEILETDLDDEVCWNTEQELLTDDDQFSETLEIDFERMMKFVETLEIDFERMMKFVETLETDFEQSMKFVETLYIYIYI